MDRPDPRRRQVNSSRWLDLHPRRSARSRQQAPKWQTNAKNRSNARAETWRMPYLEETNQPQSPQRRPYLAHDQVPILRPEEKNYNTGKRLIGQKSTCGHGRFFARAVAFIIQSAWRLQHDVPYLL